MNKIILWILLAGMVITIIVTACTPKKSEIENITESQINGVNQLEEEIQSQQTFDYSKILNGDLSDFAGIWWANGIGQRTQLDIDNGTLPENFEIRSFKQNEDRSYFWWAGFYDAILGVGQGDSIYLYPPGIEINTFEGVVPSDTTKVRLVLSNLIDLPETNTIYYIRTDITSDEGL